MHVPHVLTGLSNLQHERLESSLTEKGTVDLERLGNDLPFSAAWSSFSSSFGSSAQTTISHSTSFLSVDFSPTEQI